MIIVSKSIGNGHKFDSVYSVGVVFSYLLSGEATDGRSSAAEKREFPVPTMAAATGPSRPPPNKFQCASNLHELPVKRGFKQCDPENLQA